MRATAFAGLIGVSALALLNLVTLLATGYAHLAERRLDWPNPAAAAAPARIAAHLTPWSSARTALEGWTLAQEGEAADADAAYREALRWAPADPLLWAEYALSLARAGRFDASLTLAVARAAELAPQSPAVQNTIAELGLTYWSRGTPEQRTQWLEGMRYELAHARNSFLDRVMARGRGRTFCTGAAQALGEDAWCTSVASALLGGCYTTAERGPQPCKP